MFACDEIQSFHNKNRENKRYDRMYGVPSPPKFNVAFYILLFAFYPSSVI